MPRDRMGPHPRAVRDPQRLLDSWTAWCVDHRGTAEPDAEFRSRWIWWDSPTGRLYREGTQLVERRSPGQPSRVELHRGMSRRTLDEATVQTWIARGRTMVPLLWTSSYRRIWITPGGGQLEWQEWTRVGDTPSRTIALVDPGPELNAWWATAKDDGSLGRKTVPPAWPEHASSVARAWFREGTRDAGLDLAAGITLGRRLAAEDSVLAPRLLERVHARLGERLGAESGAAAPGHPAWREGLRTVLTGRIRSRPRILEGLAHGLHTELVTGTVDGADACARALRVRNLHTILSASRRLIGARTGRLRRRLGDLAAAWEHLALARARDAWLVESVAGDGDTLPAEARLEAGARRGQLAEEMDAAATEVHATFGRIPRGRLRSVLRALPAPPSPTALEREELPTGTRLEGFEGEA